jgi:hypothetical protein
MPNRYGVFDQGALVLEHWAGVVTHDELMAHEINQLQDTTISYGASVLVDATRASFETDADRIHELVDLHGRANNKTRLRRVGILVSHDTWDKAQLLAKQAQEYGVTVIIFSSLQVACLWLGLDPGLTQARLDALRT